MSLRGKRVQIPLALALSGVLAWSAWDMSHKVQDKPWRDRDRLTGEIDALEKKGVSAERLASIRELVGKEKYGEADSALALLREPSPAAAPSDPALPAAAAVSVPPPPPTSVSATAPRPWGRDPFFPAAPSGPSAGPGALPPPPAASGLVLMGVCTAGKSSYAIVNGVVVAIGEQLPGGDGYELKSVRPDGILLLRDGKEFYLPIK